MLKTVGNPPTRYGDQTIIDGNLVIGTAGKGIDFSVDPSAPGMTSKLLDDYEEGTFTPAIIGTTTAGTGTYAIQSGKYTKIGNLVYVSVNLEWSAHTGSGNMEISGLPFVCESVVSAAAADFNYNITLNANSYIQVTVVPNSTRMKFWQKATGTSGVGVVALDTNAGGVFTACYQV